MGNDPVVIGHGMVAQRPLGSLFTVSNPLRVTAIGAFRGFEDRTDGLAGLFNRRVFSGAYCEAA